jgi:uncharacterized protein YjiS (DUF1127 family)
MFKSVRVAEEYTASIQAMETAMFITRLIADLSSRRQRRRTTIALASLSEQQLSDLGVTRYDLFAATSRR